jgi:hypothetical protein
LEHSRKWQLLLLRRRWRQMMLCSLNENSVVVMLQLGF